MADNRGRRPPRRPTRVAGHRRRDEDAPQPGPSTAPTDDLEQPASRPAPPSEPSEASEPSAAPVIPVDTAVGSEPEAAAGAAASATPIDVTDAAAGPADASPVGASPLEVSAVGVSPAGVTSPPLAAEPWAGLDGTASPPGAVTGVAPAPAGDVEDTTVEAGREPGTGATAGPTVARPPRPRLLIAAIAALAVAALVLVAVDLARVHAHPAAAAANSPASRAAVTAAVTAAPTLLAYDYRTTATAKVAAAGPSLTASCKTAYGKDLAALSGTLDPLKVVESVTRVDGAGVQSQTGGVVVLVFLERSTISSQRATPNVEQVQVSLTMQRAGDRWLVGGVVSQGSGGNGTPIC